MIRALYKLAVFYSRRNKLKNNDLSESRVINQKAKVSNVKANEFARFAEYSDVRRSTIGSYSTIGRYTKITDTKVGKFCTISWDCTINAVSHPYDHLSIHVFPYVPHAGNFVDVRSQSIEQVIIGNDVWIGANSVIMPGITNDDGAVIGANAVVTKDVPPYAIVVGVPAYTIKKRFSDEIIEKLLAIKCWGLERGIIEKNIEIFQKELTLDSLSELEKNANI